jgi:uncharacterized iron-regulated membrane protein
VLVWDRLGLVSKPVGATGATGFFLLTAILNFWRAPRRSPIRRWVFRIHFLCGLGAGIVWTITGICGSLIVFVPELRRLEVPGATRVLPGTTTKSLDELWRTVHLHRPLDRPVNINVGDGYGVAYNVRTAGPHGERIHNFINQYTGEFLYSDDYSKRLLESVVNLHCYFLAADTGLVLNGCSALILFAMSFSGMLLWWRGLPDWQKAFRLRPGKDQLWWNVHNLGGFVFFLPLMILSLTGAYFAFPASATALLATVSRSSADISPPPASNRGDWRSLDEIVKNGKAALGGLEPSVLVFPDSSRAPFSLRMKNHSDVDPLGLSWAYLEPATARVLRVDRFDEQSSGKRWSRLIAPIHYGVFGGTLTKVCWIVFGLAPSVLFVTGSLMWWRRSLSGFWLGSSPRLSETANIRIKDTKND